MNILFLMTARGGSKGVPRKNLRELSGLSLIGYKAGAARRSKYCQRIVISTDSEEIQTEARRFGVEVPFTRPAELASDTASSADVIWHAMDYFDETEGKGHFDAIMLLEPSAPFARAEDYDRAVELMMRTRANAVVGMRKVEVSSVFVGGLDAEGRIPTIVRKMREFRSSPGRQEVPAEYTMNGALYLFGWDYFRAHRNIYHDENTYGLVMPQNVSLEIDEMHNLAYAEFLVERGYVDKSDYVLGSGPKAAPVAIPSLKEAS
ncbi:acylneuraminate cytidylyltransferase family protein [Pendulispora rubella]|uniref:Acylneuraminate cytidylyltransferase family protein n=1 Tax=Pendulispora rubella TaxID=2741070 RepID=A0ABZ2LFR2_9BACT